MKSVLMRLKEYSKEARGAEKGIIEYILNNSEIVSKESIYKLADNTFTSTSSIVRLCKKVSFKGFKDFKNDLISEVAVMKSARRNIDKEIVRTNDIESIVDIITQINIVALENTKNLIDLEIMGKCINLINESKALSVFGLGSSLIVAKDAQQKFMRINKRCSVYEDWHMQYVEARNMKKGDVGIIISYSGETGEMIKCAKEMKSNGVTIISVTRYAESEISKIADYNIFVAADESIFRSGAMSSRISQLNIMDVLYTGCANLNYNSSIKSIHKTHLKKG